MTGEHPDPPTAQLLDERARALARPLVTGREPGTQHLVVAIGDQRVAVPVAAVREVVPPGAITRVPGTPQALPGVRAVRGGILSLADAAALLGLRPGRPGHEQHVVVLADDAPLGLLVDAVLELAGIDPEDISPVRSAGTSARAGVLAGTTPAGTLVLDASAVLTDPRLDLTTLPTSDEGSP